MLGGSIGSLATMYYEPRQDRKVATVVDTQCAEDVLVGSSFFLSKALVLKAFKVINYFLITNLITFKTKKPPTRAVSCF